MRRRLVMLVIAVAGLGVAQTAAFFAIAALLLYGGFTISSGKTPFKLPG